MTLTYKVEWADGKGAWWFCTGPVVRNQKLYMYLQPIWVSQFTLTDVGNLYRFRWQVELLFKEWKSYANLHRFNTGKKAIVEGLIWASIWPLFKAIHHACGSFSDKGQPVNAASSSINISVPARYHPCSSSDPVERPCLRQSVMPWHS